MFDVWLTKIRKSIFFLGNFLSIFFALFKDKETISSSLERNRVFIPVAFKIL